MFRSKREVLASIKSRKRVVGGVEYTTYDAYMGTDPVTGQPKRIQDSDRQRLLVRIDEYYRSIKVSGSFASLLTGGQIVDAKAALDILEGAGIWIPLSEVARRFVAGEAAREKEAELPRVKLADAYREYVESFGELQNLHVKSIRSRVLPFVSKVGDIVMADITTNKVTAYLNGNRNWSPKTWNNAMSYIRSFFGWCESPLRRYVRENPLKDVKAKPIAWSEPEYMGVDATRELFRLVRGEVETHPDFLAFLILSYFCGMRTAEIERMPDDLDAVRINLEDETVRVGKPKGYQKGIRPRAFQIPENALAWMKSFDFAHGVKSINSKTRRYIGMLARENGQNVVENGGRHSFITYHVAAYGDPAKTEGIVGTSSTMRCRNYMGLASRKDGLAYFSIMPE